MDGPYIPKPKSSADDLQFYTDNIEKISGVNLGLNLPNYTQARPVPSAYPTTGLSSGATGFKAGANSAFGTDFGNMVGMQPNGTYAYTGADGKQAYTGALDDFSKGYLENHSNTDSTFGVKNGTWDNISSGIGLGLQGLGAMTGFMGMQDTKDHNKYLRNMYDEQRQQARDEISRIKQLRSDTNSNYFRDTAKNPGTLKGLD